MQDGEVPPMPSLGSKTELRRHQTRGTPYLINRIDFLKIHKIYKNYYGDPNSIKNNS